MKDQVEQLNKIGAAATTIGIDKDAPKNRNFEIVCQIWLTDLHNFSSLWHLSVHLQTFAVLFFSILTFHFAEFDTFVI